MGGGDGEVTGQQKGYESKHADKGNGIQLTLTVLGLEVSVNDWSWGFIMEIVHTYSSAITMGPGNKL